MDQDTGNIILKQVMELNKVTSRIDSKMDGVVERMDRNEEQCHKSFNNLWKKISDHDERLSIIETKLGKNRWKWARKHSLELKLTGIVSVALMTYGYFKQMFGL